MKRSATVKTVMIVLAIIFGIIASQRFFSNWLHEKEQQKAADEFQAKIEAEFELEEQKRKDEKKRILEKRRLVQEKISQREQKRKDRERQNKLEQAQRQKQVAEYAAVQFAQFHLTPRLHISPSLEVSQSEVAFKGEKFEKMRICFTTKNWLKLIAMVGYKQKEQPAWPEDTKDIDYAIRSIENTKCFLCLKTDVPLSRQNYLLVVPFARDAKWTERSQFKWRSGFEYPTSWEKHPDSSEYIYQLHLDYSDVFIIHTTTEEPLHGDIKFIQKYHRKALHNLKTKKKLGELSVSAYSAELLKLKQLEMRYCALLLDSIQVHKSNKVEGDLFIPASRYVKGSLSFLAYCRNREAALRNTNRLIEIRQSLSGASSRDIRACIAELDKQIGKCPKVMMPSGMNSYKSSLESSRHSLNGYLVNAERREQRAKAEVYEQTWEDERQSALAKIIADTK